MNRVLTVSQLNNYVKNVFEDELLLQNITVEGEVFECKFSGGNTYITLKEGDCVLPCVKFGSRCEFDAGDKIHVTGSMRFYPRGGKTTFVVNFASSVGKGEMLLRLNELKDKLGKEGVFDNKKAMPSFVRKVALVTSVEGAVIHDFLEVLSSGGCGYIDVDVYGVKVQGAGAEVTIAKALSAVRPSSDLVVVARGGGSGQDLSCFNTEAVARAVFNCACPVISAIGHEVDYTFCDFASTIRAGTPSIAAEKIVRINEAFLSSFTEKLEIMRSRVENLLACSASLVKSRLTGLMLSCENRSAALKNRSISLTGELLNSCRDKLVSYERTVSNEISSIGRTLEAGLEERSKELRYASALLEKSSPLKILSEGYAKVIKGDKSLNSAREAKAGDKLKVVMSGGSLLVTVDETHVDL